MSWRRLVFLVLLVPSLSWAGGAFDHSHSAWSKWLVVHLEDGWVDYSKAKADASLLNDYLSSLAKVESKEFEQFSQKQKKAYWINLYNAATVRLILEHYPVESIKDIGSIFSSPWKKKIGSFLGAERTLDEIEHEILRKKFPDHRIHAAVNCASKSCPVLFETAFRAEVLENQLNQAMKEWVNSMSRNRVDWKNQTIYVSKIFDWYESDFKNDLGSIQSVFVKYLDGKEEKTKDLLGFKVEYLDYDWSLNSAP